MPKESSLDKFLLLFVTAVFTVSSLSAVFFSYQIYNTNKKIAQSEPENLLVLQGKQKDTGEVLAGCGGCIWIDLYVKESGTNSIITDATVELLSKDSFTSNSWFFGYVPTLQYYDLSTEQQNLALKAGYSMPSFVSVKIAKSGYQSTTTAITTTLPGTVYLIKTSSSSPTPPPSDSQSNTPSTPSSPSADSSSSSTGTTTQTTTTSAETIKDVKLPSAFTKKGSTTTNLSKISDLKKVKNFTLEVAGKNKIVFNDTLDLSSDKLVSKFKTLDKYVKMGENGKVTIDSKNLPALNKKATITMSKLKFVTKPEILVGSKKDTEKVVSNQIYNKEKGILSFDVAHFTTLWAVPKLELTSPGSGKINQQQNFIKGTISDPTTTITGRLNEVDLATYVPDEKTGEFTIENVSFQEGENFLTLEAESEIYKILPLVTTITYSPVALAATVSEQNQTHHVLLLVSLISALIFIVLVGYLVYRKRKYFMKADSSSKTAQVYHA